MRPGYDEGRRHVKGLPGNTPRGRGANSRRMEVHNLGAPVRSAGGGAGVISEGGVAGALPGKLQIKCDCRRRPESAWGVSE